jgi:hypothetical protein
MGSVRVSGASVGERVDALLSAYWASTFNQDLRRHALPFPGGFRAWAARSRQDPLAALSLSFDPYWRNLRQVVASMSGIPADLPIETSGPPEAMFDPGALNEVRPMRPLRDHLTRVPELRSVLASSLAPALPARHRFPRSR